MSKSVLLLPVLAAVLSFSQASAHTSSTTTAAATVATGTTNPFAKFKGRRPVLHRPVCTYYKGDKKRGMARFIPFMK